tara:strand:- start:9425 stop:9565 length:141 start_codon:yes stop_codon:yes gene_type:complete
MLLLRRIIVNYSIGIEASTNPTGESQKIPIPFPFHWTGDYLGLDDE